MTSSFSDTPISSILALYTIRCTCTSRRHALTGLTILFGMLQTAILSTGRLHAQNIWTMGGLHAGIDWHEYQTEHFTIVYHEGIDSIAREAAGIAEAIYPHVTERLHHEPEGRTLIFLTDLDEIPNALALDDWFIVVWLRGIYDDTPFGGVRAGGNTKWLEGVITHEFVHTVIASATGSFLGRTLLAPTVPRWFNEGTARWLEPDGWTNDVDMVLRSSALESDFEPDFSTFGPLDGHILYEAGHSFIRWLAHRYGDDIISTILNDSVRFLGLYSFEEAFERATNLKLEIARHQWQRDLQVGYAAEYALAPAQGVDTSTVDFPQLHQYVFGLSFSPDRQRLAVLHQPLEGFTMLDVYARINEEGKEKWERVSGMRGEGVDKDFCWTVDGSKVLFSRYRFGRKGSFLRDLYSYDPSDGDEERLSSNARISDPAVMPDGSIIAVGNEGGRDRLVRLDPGTGSISTFYMPPGNTQLSTPSTSPQGSRVGVAAFDPSGRRTIVVVDASSGEARTIVSDTFANRYPLWSSDGRWIMFTSDSIGRSAIHAVRPDGLDRHLVATDPVGLYGVQSLSGDSAIALRLDGRYRLYPVLVPSIENHITSVDTLPSLPFLAWREAGTDTLEVRPRFSVIQDSGSYSPLSRMKGLPWLFPLITSDRGKEGEDGLRLGTISFLTDPLAVHQLGITADYGLTSSVPGIQINYTTHALPITLSLELDHWLQFIGLIYDIPYYEQRTGGALDLSIELPGSDDLTRLHKFLLGFSAYHHNPWNLEEFVLRESIITPEEAQVHALYAIYTTWNRNWFISGSGQLSSPALGSDISFQQLQGVVDVSFSLSEGGARPWKGPYLHGRIEATAHFGTLLTQNFLGLKGTDVFQGGVSGAGLQFWHRVRGWNDYEPGTKVMTGTLALEQPYKLIPIPLEQRIALFGDAGAAWDDGSLPSGDAIRTGYGLAYRLNLGPNFWFSTGIAFPGVEKPRRDFFVEIRFGK